MGKIKLCNYIVGLKNQKYNFPHQNKTNNYWPSNKSISYTS